MTMEEHNLTFYFSSCTRFYNFWHVRGWCSSSSGIGPIVNSLYVSEPCVHMEWLCKGPNADLGPNSSEFEIHITLPLPSVDLLQPPPDFDIVIHAVDHKPQVWSLPLILERIAATNPPSLTDKFRSMLASGTYTRMLDIGGRARSGIQRSHEYSHLVSNVDVLDVISDPGVDIVADAHPMSSVLTSKSDAVISVSVFEHLIMPWKVVLEMNKVMNNGGIAFIHTHQCLGLHDAPWDYYRYSDQAWKGLFNEHTGFEIVETQMTGPMFILPFHWTPHWKEAEKSAGFSASSVIVRKIGESRMKWDIGSSDVTTDSYPTNPDH